MQRSWINGLWATAVHAQLRRLQQGCITLVDGNQRQVFGNRQAELAVTLSVHQPRFYRRIALGGGLGAAESLMDGDWSCDDLTSLVRIFIRNSGAASGLDRGWAWITQALARFAHWRRSNTRTNARANIREHYDLGNEFFRLFLDDTLCYSSGLFPAARTSLREASLAKMQHACQKLALQPDDHLLEIGTGWGGLAIHAAQHFGCRVTTSTISAEQHELASERVRSAGLAKQVQVERKDYRDLQGQYDKLVSIEMIEAVGHRFLDSYFGQCSRLLRPDGTMLLQSIVIKDQLYRSHRDSVDFIGKYIFPGGFLPSISAINESVARATDFRVCHLEEMSSHYVRTLQAWREKFWRNIDAVRQLGFDDRFIRMWDYYFRYCEAAFAERQVNVVQIVLAKPEYRGNPAVFTHLATRPACAPASRLRSAACHSEAGA